MRWFTERAERSSPGRRRFLPMRGLRFVSPTVCSAPAKTAPSCAKASCRWTGNEARLSFLHRREILRRFAAIKKPVIAKDANDTMAHRSGGARLRQPLLCGVLVLPRSEKQKFAGMINAFEHFAIKQSVATELG